MSGLRFNLHRDALGRVPPPKHNRPNGKHAATPLQESLQNGAEENSPEPEAEAEGRSDARLHPDIQPVWDAVCANHRHVFDHLTGEILRSDVGLETVIRAFHTESVRLQRPLYPGQMLAIFECCPDGPFAHSVGTEEFAKQISKFWQDCIDAAIEARRKADAEAKEAASWLTISDEPWDEDTLPPPPWLAAPYLMRGQISLLHGPGAAGKSLLIIAWAIALALGKAFGRLVPKQRCRVILTNFEDKAEEQMRRISAALRFFGATPADLKGWLYRVSLGPKGDATMFELDEHGQVRATPCWHALERACETIRPDAVALDPLVAINAVPENDNTLMRRVMTSIRMGCPERFDCALAINHHDSKSAGDDEDSDQGNARGAGDIVNAVRFELAVKKMTKAQAEGWSIDVARRGYFFRVGSVASKVNYAEPADSEWFERLAEVIAGVGVPRCIPWQPPSGKLDEEQTRRLIEAIGKGTPSGPYSPQLGNTKRSLSPVFEDIGITAEKAQRRALDDLLQSRQIEKAAFKLAGRGNDSRMGLRTAARFPYNCEWCDTAEAEPC